MPSHTGQNVKNLTYSLTPWIRVLLEKLTGFAASQEIPRIFGTRRFITVLTSARHPTKYNIFRKFSVDGVRAAPRCTALPLAKGTPIVIERNDRWVDAL